MAMQVGERKGAISDINVTPFIDVCLVLLIIFMVIVVVTMAHLGFLAKLPQQQRAEAPPPGAVEQIVIKVSGPCPMGQLARCKIFINRNEVNYNELFTRVSEIIRGRSKQTIFFTADDNVNYQNVIDILDTLKKAGVKNIGIPTEPIRMETLNPEEAAPEEATTESPAGP